MKVKAKIKTDVGEFEIEKDVDKVKEIGDFYGEIKTILFPSVKPPTGNGVQPPFDPDKASFRHIIEMEENVVIDIDEKVNSAKDAQLILLHPDYGWVEDGRTTTEIYEVLKNTRLAPTKKGLGSNFTFAKRDGLVIEAPNSSPKRYRLSRKGIDYLSKFIRDM